VSAPAILFDGPKAAPFTICLAHGAGAPMDSPFMQAFAEGIAARGFRAARFEFPYMAERRRSGRKKPPDRAPVLLESWRAVIAKLGGPERLIVGGKSMGGRMASLVADEIGVSGLVCLGYPFHSPGKPPGPNRLEHLEALKTPSLICQGTRDPFGTSDEVPGYKLSKRIKLIWLEDGDHSFVPRKKSGLTEAGNWTRALDAIDIFAKGLRL
jgi:predicted alpha/beta-hydrolase family hydrolase